MFITKRELNAPPYKLFVRPSFTQSGCFRVMAWQPATIWVCTAPGTWTRYTRRPRGYAGAAVAFEFGFRKGCFARQFVHQTQERLRELRQTGKRNCAGIRACAGREVRADAPQIFFDLAAGAPRCSRAHDGGGHFRESGCAICNRCVSRAEKEFAVKF